MGESVFPRFLDESIDLRDVRGAPEPITHFSADVFNWLATKLMGTQRGIGVKFGLMSDMGLADGYKQNMNNRVRIESDEFTCGAVYTHTVLFTHTTNLGTTQRFYPTTEPKIYFTITTGFLSGRPGPVFNPTILFDANSYPYGFTFNTSHLGTGAKVTWLAVQNWEAS